MPLQNRVDPFGDIHAVEARGMFTGNRGGAIHDPATKTLLKKRWANKSWIICTCDYKGRRREVMGAVSPESGSVADVDSAPESTLSLDMADPLNRR